MFKIVIKKENGSDYDTPSTNNVHHKGDIVTINGEKWVVIGGDILP